MFLTESQLKKVGFIKVGRNVLISDKASIYGAENIRIGNNVRIDDFCILSGNITIGNNIHIACYSCLIGKGEIILRDFSGVSMGCKVLSSSDDYSGDFMTSPVIDEKFRNVHSACVVFGKHSLIGAGTIVLPGVSLGRGSVIGANSLVKDSVPDFEIWGGSPAKFLKMRNNDCVKYERLCLK